MSGRPSPLEEQELVAGACEPATSDEAIGDVAGRGKHLDHEADPVTRLDRQAEVRQADGEGRVALGVMGAGPGDELSWASIPHHRVGDPLQEVTDPPVPRGLGEAMVGLNVADRPAPHRLAERGW